MRKKARFPIVSAFVSIFILLFLPQKKSFAQAPDIIWQKIYGGTNADEPATVIQTSDGGFFLAGWSYSNDFDFTGNHSLGNSDTWVIKMDPMGNIQWKKNYGGSGWDAVYEMKQTKDGGYILCGNTYSNDGDLAGKSHGSSDGLVLKLDKSGNIQWIKSLGGYDTDDFVSVDLSQDGGYILSGITTSYNGDVIGNHGDQDGWIVKLDENGNLVWQRCIGGGGRDGIWSVRTAADGGYIFAGHSNPIAGDISVNRGKYDIITGKLDPEGNLLWTKTLGGSADEFVADMVISADGGYTLAGYTYSFDGDIGTNHGTNDIWIIKLDKNGMIQWEKTYGGYDYDEPNSIAVTKDGGYIVGGRTRSSTGDITFHQGDNDCWLLKLDAKGSLLWQKSLGGELQDISHSVIECKDGSFLMAAATYSDNGDVVKNVGRSDMWIVKLGACFLDTPPLPGNILGSISPCAGSTLNYSIDPVNFATGYTWSVPDGWNILSGQGTNKISVAVGTGPGQIGVIAFNTCKSSDQKAINPVPVSLVKPQISINSDKNEICKGILIGFTAKISGARNPKYQWKKNGIDVGQNAFYYDNLLEDGDSITCTLTSVTECGSHSVESSAIIISVLSAANPAINISSSAVSVCQGSNIEFSANAIDPGSNPIFKWYVNGNITGSNLPVFNTHTLADGDLIHCELISSEKCKTSEKVESDKILININSATTATVKITSPKTTICKNEEILFHAEVNNGGVLPTFKWYVNGVTAGSNSPLFTARNLSDNDEISCVLTPGSNTCATGNAFSNKIVIKINPLPQIVVYPIDTLVKPGSQVSIRTEISESILAFEWTPARMLRSSNLLEPTTVPIYEPVTLNLNVTTKDGCPINKEVKIKPLYPLYIPNAITPNGDGKNDVFRIPPGSDFTLESLSVYNRWGEKIFSSKDANQGWDGRFKGIDQPSGSYIYEIKGIQQNKRVSLKGSFILIR